MRRRTPAIIAGLFLLAVGANCSLIASSELKNGIGASCSSDDDCQGGVCSDGLCSLECSTSDNCPDPAICISGLCKLGCIEDDACGEGQICEGNACQVGCRNDQKCGSGQICQNLTCVTGCRADEPCGAGKICEHNACVDGCRTDTSCGTGKICEQNTCVAGCRTDNQCGEVSDGKICVDKECVTGCRNDDYCASQVGTICNTETNECVSGCKVDDTCGKGFICEKKECVPGCRNNDGCLDGDYCSSEKQCKPTLKVAAVFSGDSTRPAEDALTASHKLGLDQAVASADYVLFGKDRYRITDNASTAQAVEKAIGDAVAAGAKTITTHTPSANAQALVAAAKFPNVNFILTGARDRNSLPNVGAYSGKSDQQWYATGRLAARRADRGTKCIGLVLPTATRQIVRETNAFARGVASFGPDIKVVLRWLGATRDRDPSGQPTYTYKAQNYEFDTATDGKLYREELLAAQLADMGCTVIGHRTDTQRVISFIDLIANRVNVAKPHPDNHNLLSLGVDMKDQCRTNANASGSWIPTCLGLPYWNWGPLYSKIFDEMNRDAWLGQETRWPFQVGASAIMKFELSPNTTTTGITTTDVNNVLAAVANDGWDKVFKGPYSFNGQRDLDRDGVADPDQNLTSTQKLSEEEVDRMCWFVQGVWELPLYKDIVLATVIPAMVPYGPPVSGQVTELNNTPASKDKYGDVATFITTKLSQNPSEVMSCPLN